MRYSQSKITEFVTKNRRTLPGMEAYFTKDTNQDRVQDWDKAKLKVLVVFASTASTRAVSNTFTCLNLLIHAGSEEWTDIFVDNSYMPEADTREAFIKEDIPMIFGSATHRSWEEYDVIMFSHSIMPECINFPYIMEKSSIPLTMELRQEGNVPLIVYGGAASAGGFSILGGKVNDLGKGLYDIGLLGAGEVTIPPLMEELIKYNRSVKEDKADVIETLLNTSIKDYLMIPNKYDVEIDPESNLHLKKITRLDSRIPEKVKVGRLHEPNFYGFYKKIFSSSGGNAKASDVQISSGCTSGSCSFCSEGQESGHWTEKDLEHVVSDLKKTRAYSAPNTIGAFCLAGDSLIKTPEGTHRIRDMAGRIPDTVLTSKGLKRYDSVVSSGIKELLEIRTERGYTIKATPEHWFKVYNARLEEEWVQAKDLEVGDPLTLYLGKPESGEFDRDGYLAGLWFGDGSQPSPSNRDILFGKNERHLFEWVESISKDVLVSSGERTDGCLYIRYRKEYSDVLSQLVPDKDSGIPESIWKASDSVKISFIKGLFDSDGTVSGETASFTQAREKFVYDLQTLMLEFGMLTRVSKVKQDGFPTKIGYRWDLALSGKKSYDTFVRLISFRCKDKKDRLEARMDERAVDKGDGDREGFYTNPRSLRQQYEEENGKLSSYDERYTATRHAKKLTRSRALLLSDLLDREDLEYLVEWIAQDKVVSITSAGKQEVYDVLETETNDFVANGFVVHNSFNLNYYKSVFDLYASEAEMFSNLSMINQRLDVIGAAPEYLELAKRMGLRRISAAIEGMGERIRNKILNKNLSFDQIKAGAREIYRHKLLMSKYGMIITGHEETEDFDAWKRELEEILAIREELGANTAIQISHTPLVFYSTIPLRWMERRTARFSFYNEKTMGEMVPFYKEKGIRAKYNGRGPGTYIEQLLLDLGFAGTGFLVDVSTNEGLVYERHFGDKAKEMVLRSLGKFNIDPTAIFPERPLDYLFSSDIIEFTTEKNLEMWKEQHKMKDFSVRHCLKTPANLTPSCRDCGFCFTPQEKLTVTKRKIESENKVSDIMELLSQSRSKSEVRVVVQLRRGMELYSKEMLAHYITSLFLRKDESVADEFYAVSKTTCSWSGDKGQKAWFGGKFAFDIKFKSFMDAGRLSKLVDEVNKELDTCRVVRVSESAPNLEPAIKDKILYMGEVNNLSLSVLKDKMVDFDWNVKIAVKGMGDLETELQPHVDLKDKILFIQHQGKVLCSMTLNANMNPYLILSSITGRGLNWCYSNSEFSIMEHGQEVDASCSCGEPILYSHLTGKTSSLCPTCTAKRYLYVQTRK